MSDLPIVARWGHGLAPLPDWRNEQTDDSDQDDDEPLAEPPADVLEMLGISAEDYAPFRATLDGPRRSADSTGAFLTGELEEPEKHVNEPLVPPPPREE
jgi:hypothetical protein